MPARECHFIEVFHPVYRRDRLQEQCGSARCLAPTIAQLQEIQIELQARGIAIETSKSLAELRRITEQLRQYDIWSYREPLEYEDPETRSRQLRSDLPMQPFSELDMEQQELLDF